MLIKGKKVFLIFKKIPSSIFQYKTMQKYFLRFQFTIFTLSVFLLKHTSEVMSRRVLFEDIQPTQGESYKSVKNKVLALHCVKRPQSSEWHKEI